MEEFNRLGVPGWYLNKQLGRRDLNPRQMRLFEWLLPVAKGMEAHEARARPQPDRRRPQAHAEPGYRLRMADRRYRAGESIEDICRACKMDRMHTVIVVDGDGRPIRVSCGYCDSEHNYRGGPARPLAAEPPASASRRSLARARWPSRGSDGGRRPTAKSAKIPFPSSATVNATAPPVSVTMSNDQTGVDLEILLRRIIREETGLTPVAPADKWRNGQLVLRPGTAGLQEKSWPIETFFHKVVMLRNRLRTLEQQINATDLPEDAKVKLQGYVTGCYGSLTSFNVLFADEDDQFRGAGGND